MTLEVAAVMNMINTNGANAVIPLGRMKGEETVAAVLLLE